MRRSRPNRHGDRGTVRRGDTLYNLDTLRPASVKLLRWLTLQPAGPPPRLGRIAAAMRISQSFAKQQLQTLAESEYVERVRDRADDRYDCWRATPKGLRALGILEPDAEAALGTAIGRAIETGELLSALPVIAAACGATALSAGTTAAAQVTP